jgi:MFS transporter, DHA1 family, multidrug resistance protein
MATASSEKIAPEAHSVGSRDWLRTTILFALANFAEVVLFANLAAFTPVYLQHLGFDSAGIKFWTGILASLGVFLGFWFVPFWGVLADRYGRKPLIVRSYAVEFVAVILIALSPNLRVFMIGRMITGLALGNTGLMLAAVSERAPRERVGLAISLITGSGPLGGVLGSFIGGIIVAALGITALWWFDAFLIGGVFLMVMLFYHEPFTRRATPPIARMLRSALRAVVTTPVVAKYFVFSFLATSGFFFSYAYISTRILELSLTTDAAATIGVVFGIAGIATLIATPIWGTLADRFGAARLLPIVTFFTALAYVPLYFVSNVAQFTLFYFVLSAFSPAVNSLTFAAISLETPPERRNSVLSMIFMPLNAAIIVAPALASVATQEVRHVFLYSTVFGIAAFALLLLTRHVGKRAAEV